MPGATDGLIGRLDHVGFAVADLARMGALYEDIVGLTRVNRLVTGYERFRAAWYMDEHGREVHLYAPDEEFAERTNSALNRTLYHHVAFEVADFDAAKDRLDRAGFVYYETHGEGVLSRRQLYVEEPAGYLLELFEQRDDVEREYVET